MTDPAPAPRRRRIGLVTLLLIVLVLVLASAVGVFLWSGDDRGPGEASPSTSAAPVSVRSGEAFTLAGFSYEAGWQARVIYGEIVMEDLVATKLGDRDDMGHPKIEVAFEEKGKTVASVSCSASPLKGGESMGLQCLSQDEPPREYDRIVVSDAS